MPLPNSSWAHARMTSACGALTTGGGFIVVSGESGEETAVAPIHADAADFVSRDHVDCLGVVVARCLRQRAAWRMRARADEAARESRERFQASIETLSDPFVSVRPLRDQAGRIVDFVYEYANGAACLTNILAREDLVGDVCPRPGLEEYGVGYAQGYVIGHSAPIAGLLEECPPWPT
jgi:hypothetical protein